MLVSMGFSWQDTGVGYPFLLHGIFLTQVQSLGQEDPLEKGMATHCRILAWRIPRTEEPSRLQSMGL